jgi:hypothetical protein
MKTSLLLLVSLFALPFLIFGQGSITPSGTPGPTMKSLDQIEARTPISSLPFTISTSGSYYLTKNLTAAGSGAGITVSADNVSIDLKGFTLTGGGGGTVAGINVPAGQKNLCVRNGTVTGWTNGGIRASNVSGSLYQNLFISNTSGEAALTMGYFCVARSCVVQSNTGGSTTGISGGSSLVSHCNSSQNSGSGISVFEGSTVINCVAAQNHSNGITASTCTVADCAVSDNGASGISASQGSSVVDCTAVSNNTGISVDNGSSVRNCTAKFNPGSGIYATSNCTLVGNTCNGNNTANNSANAGIYTDGSANTIDSNSCTSNGNGVGISTPSPATKNIIVRNSCSGNGSGNYQVGSSAYGPIIDMSAGGPISSASGTVNPWTNWIH